MTGFSAAWLAQRAGADARARDAALLADAARIADGGLVVDIGGGAGATMRALGPHAPRARWRIVDADVGLLALAPQEAEAICADLAASLDPIFTGAPTLIAASAFFDLASAEWIDGFTDRLAAARLPLYAALTYDGREAWRPDPPHETKALAAFHADMTRDKGLGPALGPKAHDRLAARLRGLGYLVREAASDWRLTKDDDSELLGALARGGGGAVRGALPDADVAEWMSGRGAARSALVGHRDLLALPA